MVVISKAKLTDFGSAHPDSIDALNNWWTKTKEADWGKFADVKRTFNTVDYVGNDRYIFNIKGNKYRLVAMIFFDIRTVYIRYVNTHAEYDKIDCETI